MKDVIMSRPQMLVVAAALGLAFSQTVLAAPAVSLRRAWLGV